MEEDAKGYTASERAYMDSIGILEGDSIGILEGDVDMVGDKQEEEEERYYLREEQGLGNVVVINKLRLHINEARSMRKEARIGVGQAKDDTHNKVPVQQMHIVAIVDFCQNVQLPSHKKDQPGETYFFVPLNIFVLGIVDWNSEKDHLHAYMYTEAEGGKGGNLVASLIMKYFLDQGLLDG